MPGDFGQLGSVSVAVIGDLSALKSDFDAAKSIAAKSGRDLGGIFSDEFAKAVGNIAKVGGILSAAGTAISAALIGAAKVAANYGDELDKAAEKTGLTVQELGRLKYAADQSNTSFEGISTGLKFLSKNLFDAATGSKQQAQVFKALGVETKTATGAVRPLNDVLLDVADVFKKLPDGVAKGALSMKVFGKSGQDIIPFLDQGRDGIAKLGDEAERAGIVMDAAAAKLGNDFNKALDRTKTATLGLTVSIGNVLLPALTDIVDRGNNVIIWASGLARQFPEVTKAAAAFAAILLGAGGVLLGLAAVGAIAPKVAAGLLLVQGALADASILLAVRNLKDLGAALELLAGTTLTSTARALTGLLGPIAAVGAGFALWKLENVAVDALGLRKQFDELKSTAYDLGAAVLDAAKAFLVLGGNTILGALGDLGQAIKDVIGPVDELKTKLIALVAFVPLLKINEAIRDIKAVTEWLDRFSGSSVGARNALREQAAEQKKTAEWFANLHPTIKSTATNMAEFMAETMGAAGASGDLDRMMQELLKSMDQGTKKLSEFDQQVKGMVESVTKDSNEARALEAALRQLEAAHVSTEFIVAKLGKAIADITTEMERQGKTVGPLTQKYADLVRIQLEAEASLDRVDKKLSEGNVSLAEHLKHVSAINIIYDGLIQKLPNVEVGLNDETNAIDLANKSLAEHEARLNRNATAAQLLANIEKGNLTEGLIVPPPIPPVGINAGLSTDRTVKNLEDLKRLKDVPADVANSIRQMQEAGKSNAEIIAVMGDEIEHAAEVSKALGIPLDENTKILLRQVEATKASNKAAEDWRRAWSTAVGNITSKFADGVTDMIFEGKKFSANLKNIFTDLGKSLVKILVTDAFTTIARSLSGLASKIPGVASVLGNIGLGAGAGLAAGGSTLAGVSGAGAFGIPLAGAGLGAAALGGVSLAGVSGAGAFGIPLASAGTGAATGAAAGGATFLGMSVATAIPVIGGAIAAALVASHYIGQGRRTANEFVQGAQNPFGENLKTIVDAFNEAVAAGKITSEQAAEAKDQVMKLWSTFQEEADKFAAQGSTQAKVVGQAYATLDPLIKQITSDMSASIDTLKQKEAVAYKQAIEEQVAQQHDAIDLLRKEIDYIRNESNLDVKDPVVAKILAQLESQLEELTGVVKSAAEAAQAALPTNQQAILEEIQARHEQIERLKEQIAFLKTISKGDPVAQKLLGELQSQLEDATGAVEETNAITKSAKAGQAITRQMLADAEDAAYAKGFTRGQNAYVQRLPAHQSGTPFVETTGPANLHYGERVLSAFDNASFTRSLAALSNLGSQIRAVAPQPSAIAINIGAPVVNANVAPVFNGSKMTTLEIRDVLIPEIVTALDTGIRGTSQKLTEIIARNLKGLTSAQAVVGI